MKVSEITQETIREFLRLDDDEPNLGLIPAIFDAAVAYVKGYTGMDDEELDGHDDIALAVLILCQDMFDNRAMYVDKTNINRVVDSLLFMHRLNFVPGGGVPLAD